MNFDLQNRKSIPIPDEQKLPLQEIVSNAKNITQHEYQFSNLEIFRIIPQNSFCCKFLTKNTDMDEFCHTTQAVYVDLACECAAQASVAGFYKRLTGDILSKLIKRSNFLHVGESKAGDVLSVHTWEDSENPLLIYFSISKSPDNRICFVLMEFYQPVLYSHL